MWFIEPTALVHSPRPGTVTGAETPGTGSGASGKPEERQRVAAAHVEEEVLARAARQVKRLDQPHAEHLGVELHGPLHVRADQRQVIDAAEIELLVPPLHEVLLDAEPGLTVRTKSKLSFSSTPGQVPNGRTTSPGNGGSE